MFVPPIIWLIFLFAFGACVGSFLNVVVYRLPREISLVSPPSHCTSCLKHIAWYDNIPILAWFYLGGKCRHCKAPYSIRYAMIELLTAIFFAGFYWLYFVGNVRQNLAGFEQGGWMIYLGHMIVVAVLISSSLIDAELWIIPLHLSYFMAFCGFGLSFFQPYVAGLFPEDYWRIMPYAGVKIASQALGATVGLIISLILVRFKLIKRSFYELEQAEQAWFQQKKDELEGKTKEKPSSTTEKLMELEPPSPTELGVPVNVRHEMMREMTFLAPVFIGALVFWLILGQSGPLNGSFADILSTQKWLSGLSGSLFGFMIGGGIVWLTRILGTLAFGREAMGLGDVHLMAGVGAVLGWITPLLAFFVAPFAGLGWALSRLVLRQTREIPYGPFLSFGTLVVMIYHDPMVRYFIENLINMNGASGPQ